MQKLVFPEEYFKEETRRGFVVEEMMKRAWACQMEVLAVIDDICEKKGIKWFAYYGTLLGTVRHNGFIPWDDDIDIAMTRPNYNRFIKECLKELPNEYYAFNIHNDPTTKDYMTRVVNHTKVDRSEEWLSKNHGCPYCCGVDIFPLDYIPKDQNVFDTYVAMKELTAGLANVIECGTGEYGEIKQALNNVEKIFKTKIDRGQNIPQQLRILAEKVMGMYGPEDADYFWSAPYFKSGDKPGGIDIAFLEDIVKLPFEVMEINIPKRYEYVAEYLYGDYKQEKQYSLHDYPFYKKQEEGLAFN